MKDKTDQTIPLEAAKVEFLGQMVAGPRPVRHRQGRALPDRLRPGESRPANRHLRRGALRRLLGQARERPPRDCFMNLVPPWSGCRGYRVKSLATAVLLVLAAAHVQPALMAQTPAPVIEKLKPASGPVGTNVKIKGSNFGTSPGTVTFNGTNAPVNPNSNWDSAKIQVKVPEGATTGPVVVTTAGGTQSSAGVTFTVTSAPSGPIVSKLEPDSGPVGTEIKIKGSNFGNAGTVTFNGLSGIGDPRLERQEGPGSRAGGSDRWAGGGDDGRWAAEQWGHLRRDRRRADHLQAGARFGTRGLTQVKIKGTNFGDQEGTVTFNGVTASASQWNHEIIRTQVPQGATPMDRDPGVR